MGFNVFKTSKRLEVVERNNAEEDGFLNRKRNSISKLRCVFLISRVPENNLLRKQYNLHVSGNNVSAPLKNFGALRSGYQCRDRCIHWDKQLVASKLTCVVQC